MAEKCELEKGGMIFKLKGGSSIVIRQEDIQSIITKIATEALLDSTIKINFVSDSNASKARELYKVLCQEKDMDLETRKQYHEKILWLYSNSGEPEISDFKEKINNSENGSSKRLQK